MPSAMRLARLPPSLPPPPASSSGAEPIENRERPFTVVVFHWGHHFLFNSWKKSPAPLSTPKAHSYRTHTKQEPSTKHTYRRQRINTPESRWMLSTKQQSRALIYGRHHLGSRSFDVLRTKWCESYPMSFYVESVACVRVCAALQLSFRV